jgi:predicted molibdopterin-dependent oxidoreductase YjgC
MVRSNGQLTEVSWDAALDEVAKRLQATAADKVGFLTTTEATNEALVAASKLFADGLGVAQVGLFDSAVPKIEGAKEGMLADIEEADLIVVVGVDPVADQPVASFVIKRTVNKGARLVVVDGGGNGLKPFAHKVFDLDAIGDALTMAEAATAPVVVYGADLSAEAATSLQQLGDKTTFVVLEPGANTRAAAAMGLDNGFTADGLDFLFVAAGEDEPNDQIPADTGAFLVAQASFKGTLTDRADVVLPAAIWCERSGSMTNTEGRVQQVNQAVKPAGDAKPDWEIFSLLASKLGQALPDSLEELSELAAQQL